MKIDKTKNIDQLYDELPEPERTTAMILRELVFETIDVKKEKLSWGAPFYYCHSPICFIWPASIPWGKIKEGVALGFWRGKDLDAADYFDATEGKQVYRKVYFSPEEIDVTEVQEILRRAAGLDEATYLEKQKK